jgi:Ni/Co efflux regulator RcnB
MIRKPIRTISLTAAALMVAIGSAGAQGKSQQAQAKDTQGKPATQASAAAKAKAPRKGEVIDPRITRPRDRDDARVVYGNGQKVPPGLAKKPGQMPPGQYKKYSTRQGASVLGDIFGRRGYPVQRITTVGEAQHVYYRLPDGRVARAVVTQGPDRLRFAGVPQTILQQLLAQLY